MFTVRFMVIFRIIFILSFIALLTGCGGSSGGGKASAESSPVFTISGKVSGENHSVVSIALSGANSGTTKTDDNGNYSFDDLTDGSYTLAPSGPFWYIYTPTSQAVTINGANAKGINFTSYAANNGFKYSISGFINVDGMAKQGVIITLSGTNSGTAATDDSGYYSFPGLINGGYTLTPSTTKYTFTPTSKSVTVNGVNATANNFTATSNSGMTNSKFNGAYDVNFTIGTCSHQSFTEIIGNDSNRKEDFGGDNETQYYLYIQSSGTLLSYSYDSDGDLVTRKIAISDHTITIDESWEENASNSYTGHFIFTFSDDYESFSISGSVEEADPSECHGVVSGTGTRK